MREIIKITGMVLKASPIGEMDRRLVILTRQRGRISAFARGARRPGNMLMAAGRPFAFGEFSLYEGRDSYTLQSAEISNYFQEVTQDMENTCYGSYFLELAEYYTRENLDESEMIKLLYQSLRALSKEAIPNELVRRVFELRSMVINGEYTEHPSAKVSESANYAWEYVIASPVESLYTFTVAPEVLREFSACVEKLKRQYIDRTFHSLEILKTLSQIGTES